MTLEEIREIRTKMAQETKGMSTEDLIIYHKKGADRVEEMIAEHRREREANNKKVAIQ